MKRFRTLAVSLLFSLAPLGAFSQAPEASEHESHTAAPATPPTASGPPQQGQGSMGMGMRGTQHGGGMKDMHARMHALHEHSKKMEGMTDQRQLGEEMKHHMKMMDEMMEMMMQAHGEQAPASSTAP